MSAKSTDLGRVQEIYEIVTQTQRQIQSVDLTKGAFLSPSDAATDLIAESVMNRVFRAAEEAGRISEEAASARGPHQRGGRESPRLRHDRREGRQEQARPCVRGR